MNWLLRNKGSRFVVPILVAGVCGCLSGGQPDAAAGAGGGSRPDAPGRVVAQLQRAEDCEDLLTRIHEDAVAKVTAMGEQYREAAQEQRTYYESEPNGTAGAPAAPPAVISVSMDASVAWDPEDMAEPGGGAAGSGWMMGEPGSAGSAGSMMSAAAGSGDFGGGGDHSFEPAPTESGGARLGGAGADAEETAGPSGHSGTNVQVEDVDEADIVKVDGNHNIYVLHGNQLFVVTAWPPSDLALGADLVIEGAPLEMFVHDGRAVVYSRVYDDGTLGAEDQDPYADDYDEYYYDDSYCGVGPEFTKISLIDVNGDVPAVVREVYVQGSYRSGRLHGSLARTVVQGGFKAPGLFRPDIGLLDPWGRPYAQKEIDSQIDAWRDRMVASIRGTVLSDWLPLEKELVDGEVVDVERRCRDFYLPSPGLTEYGMTNIVALDITGDSGALSGATILGRVSEVYASKKTMLLAHQQWTASGARGEEIQRTALHSFELSADQTLYSASGFVPGHILNQFSMDVADKSAIIRLGTTEEPRNPDRRFDNRVFTLKADGDELKVLGTSERLGHENERIFSTRFVGDMAYVVTFEQTDPLIVIDLSDPEKPTVLGEAVIPGFSDYMHPLDDDHLLTIGRNTDNWGNDIGLMLQIFDVSEPTDPERVHNYPYIPEGYSEANHNHKAFTYWAERRLLAFPFVNYGYEDPASGEHQPYPTSTLEVFEVSAKEGFNRLGAVDHTSLMLENGCLVQDPYYLDEYYWTCSQPEVRRGIFMDDYVYAISYAGVSVNELSDLDEPVAQVALPAPTETDMCYGYDDWGEPGWAVGGAGTAGSWDWDPMIAGMGGAGAGGMGGDEWMDAGEPEWDPSAAGTGAGGAGAGGIGWEEWPDAGEPEWDPSAAGTGAGGADSGAME